MSRSSCVFIGMTIVLMAAWLCGAAGCATDDVIAPSEREKQVGPATVGEATPVPMAGRTETDLVNEMVLHRATYMQYLRALATFYSEHGYEQKARWARTELAAMQKVRQSNYLTDNQAAMAPGNTVVVDTKIPLTGITEADLVEDLFLHRKNYQGFLQTLVAFYSENGMDQKANQARVELKDFGKVKQYIYIMDAELPMASLQPTESIGEADALYEQGLKLLDRGGHRVIIFFNRATMNNALAIFKDLISKYPTSDKIDDAAYYIAEIYKEYGEEKDNQLAIEWYKRAIDWNPKLPHPAWSHAAHILDFRMHEREKALEWYQKVLEHEEGMDKVDSRFAMNVKVAHKRIGELSGEVTRHAPGDSAPEPRPQPTGSPMPGEDPSVSPAPRNVP